MRIRTEAFFSVDEIISIFISFLPFAFAQLLFVIVHVWFDGESAVPTTFNTHAFVFRLLVTSELALFIWFVGKKINEIFLTL